MHSTVPCVKIACKIIAYGHSSCQAGLNVYSTTFQSACTQYYTCCAITKRRQDIESTHLGGVGAMRTVKGKVTLDRLSAVLPGEGGETMVKETSPLAMSSTAAASGSTLMKRARKPDQGHSMLLYSNFTLRYCPATLVLLKTGVPSNRPALRRLIQLFTILLTPLPSFPLVHRGWLTSRVRESHTSSEVQ